jgi:hypothetical protein
VHSSDAAVAGWGTEMRFAVTCSASVVVWGCIQHWETGVGSEGSFPY